MGYAGNIDMREAIETVKLKLTDKMAPFFFKKKRFKGAIGGRAGTKSQTIGDILLHKTSAEMLKIGCFREHMNTIADSVHALLEEEILRMGWRGFSATKNTIEHSNGGKFRFKGLSKNVSAVLSMQGFDIFWVEEAQFLSKESLKLITPTLRRDDSEFWFSMNPMSRLDPMSKRFIVPFIKDLRRDGFYEDDLHYIVWTNYDENPWFPASLEAERKFDKDNMPRAEYDHVWRGHFNDTVENAIILAEWFDSCIDAHKKLKFEPTGQRVVSHDPSDSGYDDKGVISKKGNLIEEALLSKIDDINDGFDWALEFAIEKRADLFTWDADGMGLGLKRQAREYLKDENIDYKIFRGSAGVEDGNKLVEEDVQKEDFKRVNRIAHSEDRSQKIKNKQFFPNLRSQKYWQLRNLMYNTHLAVTKKEFRNLDPSKMLSFSSKITELEQLRAEICKIPRNPSAGKGKFQILSKPEMKKKEIDSPNLADPVMMSLLKPNKNLDTPQLTFTNPWSE